MCCKTRLGSKGLLTVLKFSHQKGPLLLPQNSSKAKKNIINITFIKSITNIALKKENLPFFSFSDVL